MGIFLAFVAVAGVVAVVVYPLWRPGAQPPPDPIGPAAQLRALEERKLAIYAAIRELGFDYRTDKLLEADYRDEVERLKGDAIGVVRQIEKIKSQPPRGPAEIEAEIEAAQRNLSARGPAVPSAPDAAYHDSGQAGTGAAAAAFCTQCGQAAHPGDRFCAACGSPLRGRA